MPPDPLKAGILPCNSLPSCWVIILLEGNGKQSKTLSAVIPVYCVPAAFISWENYPYVSKVFTFGFNFSSTSKLFDILCWTWKCSVCVLNGSY